MAELAPTPSTGEPATPGIPDIPDIPGSGKHPRSTGSEAGFRTESKTDGRKTEEEEEEQIQMGKPLQPASPGPRSPDPAAYKRDLVALVGIFLVSTFVLILILVVVYRRVSWDLDRITAGPDAGESLLPRIPFLLPSAVQDANGRILQRPNLFEFLQSRAGILKTLAELHPWELLLGHAACFLWLQAFAIPGTIFFNLTAAPLFGMALGYPLCLLYNTVGSCFLYLMSKYFMHRLIQRFWKQRLEQFRQSSPLFQRRTVPRSEIVVTNVKRREENGETAATKTAEQKRGQEEEAERTARHRRRLDLFIYMVSLRVFPFTPNWFVNVASPHILPESPGRNLALFGGSVFVGLAPYNYITCKSGLVLSQLTSQSDIIDRSTTLQLILLAGLVFVLPTGIRWWRKRSETLQRKEKTS